jgi:hypothetical protein
MPAVRKGKEVNMKKKIRKLSLHRETLSLVEVASGVHPIYTQPPAQCYPSSPPATCPPA